jgi:hypothetical protein
MATCFNIKSEANRNTLDLQCSRISRFNPRVATQSGDILIFEFDKIGGASVSRAAVFTIYCKQPSRHF